MAEIITKEQLENASLDANSLEIFVSGSDIEDVLTRLGQEYPTLAKLVRILMETGGWKAYQTEAALLATTPTVNPSVGYAFDTKKMYLWNGTSWINEGLSQLDQAIAYANANPLFKPAPLTASNNLNDLKTEGLYKPNVGVPSLALNYPVVANGELQVVSIGTTGATQIYRSYGTFGQWVRTTDGAGNWLAWELFGTKTLVDTWIDASKAPVALATDFDVQTLTKTGLYLAFSNPTTPVSTSHLPTAGEQYYIDYFHNAGVRRMIAYARSSNSVFTCWYWGSNGWSAWVKFTIQTDLDAYKTEVNALINSKTNPLETYISDLYAKLNDFNSVKIKLVGDSITWGAGADPISPTEPRQKELTDPRNMTDPLSPTWANLLRLYLCHTFGDTTRTEDAPGSAYTKRKKFISFRQYINRFSFKSNTGAVVSGATALQNVSNTSLAKNGEVMALLGANFQSQRQNEFTFDIVSDNVSVLYVKQALGDVNDICEVYVDGVLAGTFNYYDTNVSYENEFSTTFAYGKHTIRVKNIATNASSSVLIQCCATVQKVWLINEGINGTNTLDWINKLLAGTINQYDDFVFVQLGTNDRGTRGASLFKTNLNTLLNNISTLSSNNSKVLMLTSIPDSPSNATNPAYQYNMQTVDEVITTVAKERNLAHISQYKHTTQYVINGTVIWSDGLHPNNAGHKIMYENLRDQLFSK